MGKRKKKAKTHLCHEENVRTHLLKKIKYTLAKNEKELLCSNWISIRCIDKKSKQFIIGCNAVLRALEQNRLDLVATSQQINSLLSRPISMMCDHHGIALLSLEPQELNDLDFKINRITAFGIKKDIAGEDENLKKLIQEVRVNKSTASSIRSDKE